MGLFRALILVGLLGGSAPLRVPGQDPPAAEAGASFFSGTIADLGSGRITVSRNHLGKSESRSFLMTQETKVEGKLRVNARVTVRFRSGEEGDVAVHIIVRAGTQAPPKRDYRSFQ
ncbi:MAG TPA: hypothetical protein VFL57_03735 [Bryobacteraceae bacterium]|nr:hypothetical protein [Bryobacteraceae bacterium]